MSQQLRLLDPPVERIDLTRAEKDALKLAAGGPMKRTKGGWRGTGTRLVTLPVMASLQRKGLVSEDKRRTHHVCMISTRKGDRVLKGDQ